MSDSTVSQDAVVIERIFDAPVELVWQLWTDAEHFQQWYGPNGFSVPVAEMDVQVGGTRRVCMEMPTPNGNRQMWTTGEFTVIEPYERLAYTESMADEQGNIVAPPEGMPTTTEVTVILEALDGRTKMTMTHAGVPANEGANMGWNQAFDKLTQYLETLPATQ